MPPGSLPSLADLYADVERYYTRKLAKHGPTALGVDWSCVPTQELRFVQLLKVCDFNRPFSLTDLGCGYGALLAFLAKRFRGNQVDYLGVDLSEAMIAEACRLWAGHSRADFVVGNAAPLASDYTIASGIFNVKLHQPDGLWKQFVQTTLDEMREKSRRGFAVNFLAPLAMDAGPIELYRVASQGWRDYCERAFNAKVTLLDNYGMREYTLLIRLPHHTTC
ncbi:MAG: class I SAM-dependent methyltransferase [Ramlibacter sp.]